MGTSFSDAEYAEPLLKAATPDLYKDNSFRIIGLPTDASPVSIKRKLDKAEMLIKLSGVSDWRLDGVLTLSEPINADKLFEAKRRLKDPESRLVDECFWFWPAGKD